MDSVRKIPHSWRVLDSRSEEGDMRVWHVAETGTTECEGSAHEYLGMFHDDEIYLILYEQGRGRSHITQLFTGEPGQPEIRDRPWESVMYTWIGKRATPSLKKMAKSARHTVLGSLNQIPGQVVLCELQQHCEPPFFLAALGERKSNLVVYRGSEPYVSNSNRSVPLGTRVIEVMEPCQALFPTLNTAVAYEMELPRLLGLALDRCYLVYSKEKNKIYLWVGPASSTNTVELARRLGKQNRNSNLMDHKLKPRFSLHRFSPVCIIVHHLSYCHEDKDFWIALGMENANDNIKYGAFWRKVVLPSKQPGDPRTPEPRTVKPLPRLFRLELCGGGGEESMTSERVEVGLDLSFMQQDLCHTECYILDWGYNPVFLWNGRDTSSQMRNCAMLAGNAYISELVESHSQVDDNTPFQLEIVMAGSEPLEFRSCFRVWCGALAQVPGLSSCCPVTSNSAVEEMGSMHSLHSILDAGQSEEPLQSLGSILRTGCLHKRGMSLASDFSGMHTLSETESPMSGFTSFEDAGTLKDAYFVQEKMKSRRLSKLNESPITASSDSLAASFVNAESTCDSSMQFSQPPKNPFRHGDIFKPLHDGLGKSEASSDEIPEKQVPVFPPFKAGLDIAEENSLLKSEGDSLWQSEAPVTVESAYSHRREGSNSSIQRREAALLEFDMRHGRKIKTGHSSTSPLEQQLSSLLVDLDKEAEAGRAQLAYSHDSGTPPLTSVPYGRDGSTMELSLGDHSLSSLIDVSYNSGAVPDPYQLPFRSSVKGRETASASSWQGFTQLSHTEPVSDADDSSMQRTPAISPRAAGTDDQLQKIPKTPEMNRSTRTEGYLTPTEKYRLKMSQSTMERIESSWKPIERSACAAVYETPPSKGSHDAYMIAHKELGDSVRVVANDSPRSLSSPPVNLRAIIAGAPSTRDTLRPDLQSVSVSSDHWPPNEGEFQENSFEDMSVGGFGTPDSVDLITEGIGLSSEKKPTRLTQFYLPLSPAKDVPLPPSPTAENDPSGSECWQMTLPSITDQDHQSTICSIQQSFRNAIAPPSQYLTDSVELKHKQDLAQRRKTYGSSFLGSASSSTHGRRRKNSDPVTTLRLMNRTKDSLESQLLEETVLPLNATIDQSLTQRDVFDMDKALEEVLLEIESKLGRKSLEVFDQKFIEISDQHRALHSELVLKEKELFNVQQQLQQVNDLYAATHSDFVTQLRLSKESVLILEQELQDSKATAQQMKDQYSKTCADLQTQLEQEKKRVADLEQTLEHYNRELQEQKKQHPEGVPSPPAQGFCDSSNQSLKENTPLISNLHSHEEGVGSIQEFLGSVANRTVTKQQEQDAWKLLEEYNSSIQKRMNPRRPAFRPPPHFVTVYNFSNSVF